MSESDRKPTDAKTGDVVIFNAQILWVNKSWRTLYLEDYFSRHEDHGPIYVFKVDLDAKEMENYDGVGSMRMKEYKQDLYKSFCEHAILLPAGTPQEQVFALHKEILLALVHKHHANTLSIDVLLAREKDLRCKIQESIERAINKISQCIYSAAQTGKVHVDIAFDPSVRIKDDFLRARCSDGILRPSEPEFAAFLLLGAEKSAEMPAEQLSLHIHGLVAARFPHLRITELPYGCMLPSLRLTFAEYDALS